MAQVVASHERAIFYGRHTGRQYQCAAQASAPAKCTLAYTFQAMGQLDIEQIFLLRKCIVGNNRCITPGEIHTHQIRHVITYQSEVRLIHFSFHRKEVHIFGLYACMNKFTGKTAHSSYLHSDTHRLTFYKRECLPPFAISIGVTAAQRYEYGCHTVGQSSGQQIRGSFLTYLTNLQVGTSLECAILYILDLVGQDYLG